MAAPTAHRTRLPLAWRSVPHDERFNVATAIAGLAGCMAGGAWLAARAATPLAQAAVAFCAAAFCVMFLATALHHAFPESEALRRFDHASIYLAIVGVAAPICLVAVGARAGWIAFGLTALVAAVGIGAKTIGPFLTPARNLWLYVPAPLPTLAALRGATDGLAPHALGLLGAAIALFATGAVIDAAERPNPPRIGAHGVFHVCVLGGTALTLAFTAQAVLAA